jgi:hypothetical protein
VRTRSTAVWAVKGVTKTACAPRKVGSFQFFRAQCVHESQSFHLLVKVADGAHHVRAPGWRQGEVGDDEVDIAILREADGLRRIAGAKDVVASLRKDRRQPAAKREIAGGHQNLLPLRADCHGDRRGAVRGAHDEHQWNRISHGSIRGDAEIHLQHAGVAGPQNLRRHSADRHSHRQPRYRTRRGAGEREALAGGV